MKMKYFERLILACLISLLCSCTHRDRGGVAAEADRVVDQAYQEAMRIYDQRKELIDINQKVRDQLNIIYAIAPDHVQAKELEHLIEEWNQLVRRSRFNQPRDRKRARALLIEKIKELEIQGVKLFEDGSYDDAEVMFEHIIFYDPYNTVVLDYLEKISKLKKAQPDLSDPGDP